MTNTKEKLTIEDIYEMFDKFLENKSNKEKLEIINQYENNLILEVTKK